MIYPAILWVVWSDSKIIKHNMAANWLENWELSVAPTMQGHDLLTQGKFWGGINRMKYINRNMVLVFTLPQFVSPFLLCHY